SRQAIVSVDVDPACSVENRAPVIDSAQHLIFVGFSLTESLCANVEENRFTGSTENFLRRLPAENSPPIRFVSHPLCFPIPNALLTPPVGASSDQVIANCDVDCERGACDLLDPDNFEFSRLHSRERGQVGLDLAEKSFTAGGDPSGKAPLQDLDPISRTDNLFLGWNQR